MALRLKTDSSITLKIDKLGRIVIPQVVRERLGLRPGTTLKLAFEDDNAIYLEPVREEAMVIDVDGWTVFATPSRGGETDIVKTIQEDREERSLFKAGLEAKEK